MQVLSKKIAKICHIKKMKAIPWELKIFQYLIIKPFRTFSGQCVWKAGLIDGGVRGGGQQWGGEQPRGGGGGSTVGVSSTSKNRPSHYKYKSPKTFRAETELKGSKSTYCPLGATSLSRS